MSEQKKSSGFRLFKWLGIGLLLILIILIILAAVFEKQIGSLVIKALNKQIKTELKVEEATLSLIRQFPSAAVYLNNVQLDGVGDKEKKLLNVGSISLKCSILGVLTGAYDFNSIAINDGTVYIHSDKRGKANYDVFASSESSSESSDLNLSINNFTLHDVTIHYVDEAAKHDIKVLAQTAYFSGQFMVDNKQNMDKYSMSSYAELVSKAIKLDETTYLVDKKLAYDGALVLDNAKGLYTFNQIKFYLQENEFKVDGTIEQKDKGTEYNLVFDSDNARLNSLLQLLPSDYTAVLGEIDSRAKLYFDARINGLYNKYMNPIIELNFGLKEGRLTHPDLVGSMKNVKFDAKFTNGNGKDEKTAKLELKDFTGYLNNEPVNIHYVMSGLNNPDINMSVDGKIPLGAIYKFLGEGMSNGQGTVDIEALRLSGKLNDMISMSRIPRVKLDGVVNIQQAELTSNDITTTVEQGKFTLKDNIFNIADLQINMPNNNIVVNGNFQNALPVLLSDSINSKEAKLIFKASLKSEKMDLEELMTFTASHSQEEIEDAPEEEQDSLIKENQANRELLTSFLKGTFYTNITELKYGKVLAQNFNGEITFDNSIMNMKGVKVDAMEGQFELNSRIHFEQAPYIEAFLDCKNIDLQQFLSQFDNFGQEVLTSENLHGTLQSLIKINVFFDSLGNFIPEDLFVVADMNIKDGELVDFEMLKSFASLIKIQDLQNIRFAELKNQFKIENQKFVIPAMFIQSSAINLVLGGEYSFNHDMDFKFKVNAGQVIATKFKKYNPNRPLVKARQKGLFNIYAHLFGNLYEDYDYKIGPKNTKKALEAQLSSQLPALTNTLKSEFAKMGASEAKEKKIQAIKEPENWGDIPEYEEGDAEEEEYIEGF